MDVGGSTKAAQTSSEDASSGQEDASGSDGEVASIGRMDVENLEEEASIAEKEHMTPGSNGLASLANLVGVGDDSDSSGDEAIMETMAVSDLPSTTLVEARVDEPALMRKLREITLFTNAVEDDGEDDNMKVTTVGSAKILPFRESLSVTMPFSTPLPDKLAIDDLARETAFAERTTAAVHVGLARLREQKVKFRRPNDYFAEMVKTDEHMAKVKKVILHKKARIEDAEKRRNNRDIKKNRRKVRQEQLEKEQEKKKKARDEIEAVSRMRTKRLRERAQASNNANDAEDDDEFPIEMLDVEKVDIRQYQKHAKGPLSGKMDISKSRKAASMKQKPAFKGKESSRNLSAKGPIKKKGGKKKRLGKSRRLASKK